MYVIALLLLATCPPPPAMPSDSADLIELNHFYSDEGRPVFSQWIFWNWNGYRHEVIAWRLDKAGEFSFHHRPPRLMWAEGTVSGSYWRETWTQVDPELIEREYLPKQLRRGILGKRE